MKQMPERTDDEYDSLVRIANYQAHLRMVAYLSSDLHSGMHALDVGCGTGLVGVVLSTLGITVDGIDRDENMVRRSSATGVYRHVQKGTVERLNHLELPKPKYDLVICVGVVGEFVDEKHISKLSARVTRQGLIGIAGTADILPFLHEDYDQGAQILDYAFKLGDRATMYNYAVGRGKK